MEALISEILKTIPSYTGPIIGTVATLLLTQKYEQWKQEKVERKQVPSNEHIKLLKLRFVSVPPPSWWSIEWWARSVKRVALVSCTLSFLLCSFLAFFMFQVISFPRFLYLLALAIVSLFIALDLSVGLHRESTEDQPIAEIEMSGSYKQIDAHVRRCLELLKAEPQALIEEPETLVYKLNYGRFSFSRMMKLEYKELESNRWRLLIQCGIYDRDFQIQKEKTSSRDELNLKEFVTILNASCTSTEVTEKLNAEHHGLQAQVESKDALPLIHTQVPDNFVESIRSIRDQNL